MPNLFHLFLVAGGGALGATLRYLLGGWIQRWSGGKLYGVVFPWGTLSVNLLGCLAIGLLVGLLEYRGLLASPTARLFLLTGLLGGFTTFSSFSVETLQLFQQEVPALAILNAVGSVLLGLLGVWLGDWLAR
jgi:CrcB protein